MEIINEDEEMKKHDTTKAEPQEMSQFEDAFDDIQDPASIIDEFDKEDDLIKEKKREVVISDPKGIDKVLGEGISKVLSRYYSDDELGQIAATIDDDSKDRLKHSLINMKHGGYANIPRICAGIGCPSSRHCPLMKSKHSGNLLGKQCPLEIMIVEQGRASYLMMLREEDVDINMITENYISQLLEADILDMRLNHYLGVQSENGGEIITSVVAVNPKTGEELESPMINPAIEIKKSIFYKREAILKSMVMNRFWQKKLDMEKEDDSLMREGLINKQAKDMKEEDEVDNGPIILDCDHYETSPFDESN